MQDDRILLRDVVLVESAILPGVAPWPVLFVPHVGLASPQYVTYTDQEFVKDIFCSY